MIPARTAALTPLLLTLMGCAAAASAARSGIREIPLTVRSRELTVSVSARAMTANRVNVVVQLLARRALPDVELRVQSPDRGVAITQGCTFHPLQPPSAGHSAGRLHPNPLPKPPLCSIVVQAARAGRYALDLRILDRGGRDLLAPVHTMIRIPWTMR